ncbi:hypothetical protein PN462_08340 [Spirulina sp. CS-785/01]|uniref:hypothetical protein n=1 Tax=Spirulina sp. CS-785/01 TaxID=3021716 RepID=UPI00232F186F|nr:hypothetical protein [Spirulina sp. CS-785/01]MDB9313107.1 hypothetical protein [Spirulina sp. CS-785/01]
MPTLSSQISTQLPPIAGQEAKIQGIVQHDEPVMLPYSNLNLEGITAGFACALHMHQPTIPAGENGALINNLQYMFEHPNEGDNHNAEPFAWCYSRMGDMIPELVQQGCNPRIMLDYSGNLLWGLQQMNREDILGKLRRITCDAQFYSHVEWLGTMWGHGVVSSTPIPDIKLHLQAWQHQFAAIFGEEALRRVKGFSPPEMHLPNHPDTLYEYVKALKECGYRWLLVQEHTVERTDGTPLHHEDKYIPNQLVARNSQGETLSILALIKTQGSDTKLVAQMQPYHEAKGLGKQEVNGVVVPSLVSQIADGENGGVMMNEFPRDFPSVWGEIKDNGGVVGMNGTEYLELLEQAGIRFTDLPICQGVGQAKIWQRVGETVTPEGVERAIAHLQDHDPHFSTEGASWTNHISWVEGYESVLQPMQRLSAKFHEKFDPLVAENPEITQSQEYQAALLYNLLLQTSCFRYWGKGTWTDYAKALYERGQELVES